MPIGDLGTFGLSVIVALRVPEEIVRTVDSPKGTAATGMPSSFAIGLSYARNLTDRFSVGFNAKFIREASGAKAPPVLQSTSERCTDLRDQRA